MAIVDYHHRSVKKEIRNQEALNKNTYLIVTQGTAVEFAVYFKTKTLHYGLICFGKSCTQQYWRYQYSNTNSKLI